MNAESRRMGVEIIRIPVGPQVARKKRFEERMEGIGRNIKFLREHMGASVQEATEAVRRFGEALGRVGKRAAAQAERRKERLARKGDEG